MSTTFDEYQEFVLSKMNPTALETKEGMLMNAVLGLCGEAGEIADLIKKWCYHGHDLDIVKIKKELGDINFYFNLACSALEERSEDIVQMNMTKLNARYASGFTVEESKTKNDESPEFVKDNYEVG